MENTKARPLQYKVGLFFEELAPENLRKIGANLLLNGIGVVGLVMNREVAGSNFGAL